MYHYVMDTTMSVSEARAALPDILNRVSDGDEVTITRHGKAVAVVIRPDVLRSRRASETLATASRIREAVDGAREAPLQTRGGLGHEYADELISEVRTGRDAR